MGNIIEVERVDDEFIPTDAWPVCFKCLKPCHPLQHYCDKCDSNDAIDPFTPYMPFLNIRFNYDIFLTMWRRIFDERDTSVATRLFYLCMLAMFVPGFLVIGLPFLLVYKIPQSARKLTIITLCIVAVVLLIFFISYELITGLPTRPIVR
ncbi:MAG: hypothetical protein ACYSUY_12935 [Planctomycetota bacterium]